MSTRDETVTTIREGLRKRSDRTWSVKVGRGTVWGWITISAPPARLERGSMTEADRDELSRLLGKEVHGQGEMVPASSAHYREAIDRAHGRDAVAAVPYWD